MDNRRLEFARLLSDTIVDSSYTQVAAKLKMKPLQEWIIANIPSRLYRFRADKPYVHDAFIRDEIYGSNLNSFNDPFECTPFFDMNRIHKYLEENLSPEVISNIILSIKSRSIPEPAKELMNSGNVECYINRIVDGLDESAIMSMANNVKQNALQYCIYHYSEIVNRSFVDILMAASQRNIACFSENNDSPLMWGHYADGHRGFCLEYDFKSVINICQQECGNGKWCNNFMLRPFIAPVIYSKSRFDATGFLLTEMQHKIIEDMNLGSVIQPYYGDTLLVAKSLLTKSLDWEYEKEWRLISPSNNQSESMDHNALFNLKPTAVYLGQNSCRDKDEMLFEICKMKNIKCYKMVLNYHGNDFKLFPVSYEEYRK